jgi:uncharacterized protein YkwD
MKHFLSKFLYPHHSNHHHPHAIRVPSLGIYIAALLLFNMSFNVFAAHSSNVLGFASSISQSKLVQLTNQERSKAGLMMLTENTQLDKAAQLKGQNMFKENYWAHYAPSGYSPWHWFDEEGYAYSLAGENLARDFDTSQGVIAGWMNSPSHRANLMKPEYQEIGMAVVNGTLQGRETTLVVQLFGTPVTPLVASGNSRIVEPTNIPTPIPDYQRVHDMPRSQVAGAVDRVPTFVRLLRSPFSPSMWGTQQSITAISLLLIMLFFLIDHFGLRIKGMSRPWAHSLLHATITGGLVLLVLYTSVGGIL